MKRRGKFLGYDNNTLIFGPNTYTLFDIHAFIRLSTSWSKIHLRINTLHAFPCGASCSGKPHALSCGASCSCKPFYFIFLCRASCSRNYHAFSCGASFSGNLHIFPCRASCSGNPLLVGLDPWI